jgi:heme-degrading monooxygenase HmoA
MYAWCQDMPGVTADDYAKVLAELGGAENSAPGLVAHVAGPVEGGFRIVDVWESEQAAQHFAREQLEPAVQRAHSPEMLTLRDGFQTLEVSS